MHGVRIGENIYHPLYGKYPAVVPFEQGMDILPGQAAQVAIPFCPSDQCFTSDGRLFSIAKDGTISEVDRLPSFECPQGSTCTTEPDGTTFAYDYKGGKTRIK
jgi:hypothetical protein